MDLAGTRKIARKASPPALKESTIRELATILLKEQKNSQLLNREEKMKRVLSLLANGVALATVLAVPNSTRLFKSFARDRSDWNEWRRFNPIYLRRAIRKLAKKRVIEIVDKGSYATVQITDEGRRKILQYSVESVTIQKPLHWDGKWRLVFYDVMNGKRTTRDKFRNYLKSAGFYPLQESVYLHAYPCVREIDFLKYSLGIGSEVRIVIAEKIENDREFREYFGI